MTQSIDYKYCDVVMKGGITSGIVYPLAVSELAKEYKFKNIGGTSAGAIAAAITAAAEYGRRLGNPSAFDVVADLPGKLGADGLLLRLFRPSAKNVKFFRIAIAALSAKSKTGKVFAAAASLFGGFWLYALIGGLVGALVPFALFKA